ncbi:MAG: radical SAM protein, partial [Verrucomicrobiota bacterium]
MKILLITPPLLQPNTPYAATPLLAAWLGSRGHDAVQADLSLELLLKLFSREGVSALCRELEASEETERDYCETIDEVVSFLQDLAPEAAERIAVRGYLPEGEHLARAYEQEEQLGWDFRGLDLSDRARYLASLYLDDLAEAATVVDPHFGFSRYAEKLSASLPEFRVLRNELEETDSLFLEWLEELTDRQIERQQPEMVALSVPFPGCLFGALAIARRIKQVHPETRIALGGGYVNTELRELKDPAIFDYVDFITLDSGFLPLQRLAEGGDLVRTFMRKNEKVCFKTSDAAEVAHNDLPPPDFSGLDLKRYFGMFEMLNPVTRLWSDGKWIKLVLAHGCCWRRCAFCDTSIDYIGRYDPAAPKTICDWIENTMQQTGFNGFHFVDEALPPDLLDGLCDEILRRGLQLEWWGNIRFEKRFTKELIEKMAKAGCIAVTGGLETGCDRTLKLMRKGITVGYSTRVLADFADAEILTHAYLMYGFPTQTKEETLEALETVRQLFDTGALHSAYWHRFALTAHSDISLYPEKYDIELLPAETSTFALNEIPFKSLHNYDLDELGRVLKTATYNFMHGTGLDLPVSHWNSCIEHS